MSDSAKPTEARLPPLVQELFPPPEPVAALERFAALPKVLFLDSARRDPLLGRYSFLAADPFARVESAASEQSGLEPLRHALLPFVAEPVAGLPPFQGGAAGQLGYDLGRSFERIPPTRFDEFAIPALAVGLYDVVLAWDHLQNRAWLISHGFPELELEARRARAQARMRFFSELLSAPAPRRGWREPARLPISALAPQHAVGLLPDLTSNFSAEGYRALVARVIAYIRAGDIFQANLSQRLLYPLREDPLALYQRLRECNAGTFAGYFDWGNFQLMSASPERFLQLRDGLVEARPIKGTRRRTSQAVADLFAGDELQQSEKDRSENVMIVDLLRNDLSRVCLPDSVRTTQLCELETYAHVQHLVSAVAGELAPRLGALDLVQAAFPGGSITGAPKVRAMEIIAELEPTARGPYCGSLGYLGFDGSLDLSILIRTLTASGGWLQFPVGGGIVAQSNPDREYEETWHKAAGMLAALE